MGVGTIPGCQDSRSHPAAGRRDDARWHRIYAVAGFLKSWDRWVANCSTSVTPSESALLQEIPTGGVCPSCQADNEVALAIDHLLL